MKAYTAPAVVLLTLILSACSGDHQTVTTITTSNTPNDPINLSAAGYPDAQITPSGQLIVSKANVNLTNDQRALLQKYYVTFQLLHQPDGARSDGSIKPLYQSATMTKAQVETACEGLSTMIANQEHELAAQIGALQPYMNAKKESATSCTNG